jgi:DNA-binding XRE family transcriptional regulator
MSMPELPPNDANGLYPAREFARVSMVRKVITARAELGLTQRELAKRAGIRVETLCRLESGQTVPSLATVQKLERALQPPKVKRSRNSP